MLLGKLFVCSVDKHSLVICYWSVVFINVIGKFRSFSVVRQSSSGRITCLDSMKVWGRTLAQGRVQSHLGVTEEVMKTVTQPGISGMRWRDQGHAQKGPAARGQGTCPGIPAARAMTCVVALLVS